MYSGLEAHRRYLAAVRDACSRHQIVHSHQIAALDRETALVATAGDIASYRAASGDMFELTRAAWLDRAANHARVAVAVDDSSSAEAAAIEYARAAEAAGHSDWGDCLAAGAALAAPLRARSGEIRSGFTRLVLGLLRMQGKHADLKAEFRATAMSSYQTLRSADPGFTWSSVSRRPCYFRRVPWTGSGRDAVGHWLADLVDESAGGIETVAAGDPLAAITAAQDRWQSQLVNRAPAAASANEPTASDIVAPYRELMESKPGDDRVMAAIRRAAGALVAAGSAAPTAQDALACLVTEGLLTGLAKAPMQAVAEDGLERQSQWPDPLVEHHWRTLLRHLDQANTPTEVDLIATYEDACFGIEADWNVLLLESLLGPLRAACTSGWDASEEARQGVRNAVAATYRLLGLGPRGLLSVPRAADFIARILVPLVSQDDPCLGAFLGEGGFDLLLHARGWIAVELARGVPGPVDATSATAALLRLFSRAGVEDPPPAPRAVSLWEILIQPHDLVPNMSRPNRPPVPGIPELHYTGPGQREL